MAPQRAEEGVVPGIDLTAVLHDAALELVAELFGGGDSTGLSGLAIRPVLRAVSATFEGPLTPGAPVYIGATLGSLSTRSFVLATGVWLAETRKLVAHGTASFVVFDVATRKTAAVPDAVVEALGALRPILTDSST